MIGCKAGRMYAKRGACRRLPNITLPEARCQVDRGINAPPMIYLYTTFCEEPIFVYSVLRLWSTRKLKYGKHHTKTTWKQHVRLSPGCLLFGYVHRTVPLPQSACCPVFVGHRIQRHFYLDGSNTRCSSHWSVFNANL